MTHDPTSPPPGAAELRNTIRTLEELARGLEPGAAQRAGLAGAVADHAETFLSELDSAPAYRADCVLDSISELEPGEGPAPIGELLTLIGEQVEGPGINPASGGHLGYIPGGGVYPAALGDYLADVSNRYSGVEFASPGAVRMERSLVRWMCRLAGLPESSGGDLTSGGSTANLSAIVTARDAAAIRARDIPNHCVYMGGQTHHCVDKAIRVAGLAECPRRAVALDDRFRMLPASLENAIRADRDAGLQPWLVVASAGTTDTGAVDPMAEIADLCAEHGLWLHVDAAYGGFFLLCEEGRAVLRGLDRADSIVMDPHKGLFLPYGSGAVLVRDRHLLAAAHRYEAAYMQDATSRQRVYSPADLSAELSRPFRGLRLWLPLMLFGLAPFRAALAEKIWLTRYAHHRLGEMPGFETGPKPDLSVVTYRYRPHSGDANAFNRKLVEAIHADGRVFVSSTMLDGVFWLRFAVLNFRTHLSTIDTALDLLRQKAEQLELPSGG